MVSGRTNQKRATPLLSRGGSLLAPNSSSTPASLFHYRGVIDPEEGDGRFDVTLNADFGAFAGDAANIRQNPQLAGTVVDLINPFSKSANGLGDGTRDSNFFIHIAAGISVDLADPGLLAGGEKASKDDSGREIQNSGSHKFPGGEFQIEATMEACLTPI
jgi:hypothetical protein